MHSRSRQKANAKTPAKATIKREPKRGLTKRRGVVLNAPVAPLARGKQDVNMAAKTKPDADWFIRRLKDLDLTKAFFASRVGIHATSVARFLAGEREPSASEVVAMAGVLNTTPAEILRRLGLEAAGGLVPKGRVLGDGRVSYVVDASIAVPLPGEYPVGAEALLVEAAEGPLAAWDGAAVVYSPSTARSVGPEAVGKLCVIEDSGSALPLLGVITQATGARSNCIRIFGTGEELKPSRIIKASLVLGIHFRG